MHRQAQNAKAGERLRGVVKRVALHGGLVGGALLRLCGLRVEIQLTGLRPALFGGLDVFL